MMFFYKALILVCGGLRVHISIELGEMMQIKVVREPRFKVVKGEML
jgi:hypothetical protein